MGAIKGKLQYEKLKAGKKLTRGEAVKAKCYECNGLDESNHDCKVPTCPLYPFSPYKGKK